ncbi:hypothetical protein GCM10011316_07090 [Roseibium aquae]|uniref:Uncharacterized protein n=1 Tax=Roseibium aquae TaxID=1323746 RepID=A0A916TBZ4_9HYPH|nr:DUF6384 family protein [Roseibium aquae]GGB37537.1 hypothetical protein GCM10011316_07090 [Roseibium aquae]
MSDKTQAPLDDLMMAMDVVDTLRHQDAVIEREIASGDRDAHMIARLKEIYAAQGIDVPDRILMEGVEGLKQDRFVYKPPQTGFSRFLAQIYITRMAWSKWAAGAIVALVVAVGAWQFLVVGPQERAAAALQAELSTEIPQAITALSDRINGLTGEPGVLDEAERLAAAGRIAAQDGQAEAARGAVADLRALASELNSVFEVRIVSRPDTTTGVERIPDVNREGANYYLIVEAIGPDGAPVSRSVTSEENGTARTVEIWGQRVSKELYERIRDDKMADGIVQSSLLGRKARGSLEIDWEPGVGEGAITQW